MVLLSFPSHYRDLSCLSSLGLHYSTTSNSAVKLYDALVHQSIYHYEDPQLGGWANTTQKMFEADPEFAMGKILTLGLEVLGTNPESVSGAAARDKLTAFNNKANTAKLTNLELLHLGAAIQMAEEDLLGAMNTFEKILLSYPLDSYALHLAYFLALLTGHTSRMRDTPRSVIHHYKPHMAFYGNTHGKMGFGQSEMGEFQAGELSSRLALDHFRLDNWSHHSLAHNFDESGRALQGSLFLENTEPEWSMGTSFSHHLWWHSALFQVSLGDHEAALTMYDQHIWPLVHKVGGLFPLSDASALLARLHMEGVDTGSRCKEVAKAGEQLLEDNLSLFYDGHLCMSACMAGDTTSRDKLRESVTKLIQGQTRKGWNKQVTTRVGLPLLEGITKYFDGDYSGSVRTLAPVMEELQTTLQGSRAQKDVFRQMMLQAAVKSGTQADLGLAKQVLDTQLQESGLDTHKAVNQRIMDKVLAQH